MVTIQEKTSSHPTLLTVFPPLSGQGMAPNRLRTRKRPWQLLQRQRRSRRWCRSRGLGNQKQLKNFLTDTLSKGSAVVERLEQPFTWCNVKLGMARCCKLWKPRSTSCLWYHGQIYVINFVLMIMDHHYIMKHINQDPQFPYWNFLG